MEKAHLNFMHLCEHAMIDISQKLSVIDIFSNFNFKMLPTAYAKFVVVASLKVEKDGKEHDIRITILNPDGTELGSTPFRIKALNSGDSILIANFLNREFRMPDEHRIEVTFDGNKVGELIFKVTLLEGK